MLQFKLEGCQLAEFSLSQESQSFVLFRPPTDGMRPSHSMEGNLDSKCSNLNVNLIPNTLTETGVHCGPPKLTCEINHRTIPAILDRYN